ncbi:rab-GTPase-TBC domain-domain-containing protein [Absidia repens]|uniref:Rab-GTPase-TBC domain-domain-containing protein n=1 Tax=Absidia repens TaxID=90262 RepID=A0A1X2J0F0_9FUNG|nr:rab-GTPase-TBC domain-domain-containing protein [Absidia repens]
MDEDFDEVQSNLNDYQELLQSEVYVDLDRLRILARQGVPQQIRGEVWKYLLGVQQADRSKELSSTKARNEEYEQIDKTDPDVAKRIRGEVHRFQRKVRDLEGKHYAEEFENIILAYLNTNREIEYSPAMVSLCAPFIYCLEKECDAYYCFERMMQAIEDVYSNYTIKERVANFMTLFRYVIPDLCSYFEDEEVDLNEWATSWLQNLLAKEMQFDDLLRLWDVYFAIADPLEFHPFVCLSILRNAKENLEDLEQSEIRTILLRLPTMNMRMIIAEAVNIRHETLERQMSETGAYDD